ncbi:MAG: rod shape-determining protein MreD [Lachnospiraceae bacterium]|nr:rod shape-determining protein MreD [Lachnospiraceae bacterium]
MRKIVIIALTIVAAYLLQTAVFSHLVLANVTPNILIIVTSAFGFMRGRKDGMFVGFFCGILLDLASGTLFGLYALVYMLIGYLNGLFEKLFYGDDIKLPILLIGISDFLYSIIIYIIFFLVKGRFDILFYLKSIILPEIVYTILVSIVLYFILYRLNIFIDKPDKRSRSKFV